VLAQQSSNYLLALVSKVLKKKQKAEGVFSYINELDDLTSLSCEAKDFHHFLNIENVELALKVNVAMKLKHVIKMRSETKASKKDFVNSHAATEVVRLSLAHIKFVAFLFFKQELVNIKCP
jgi:hypothetical protein